MSQAQGYPADNSNINIVTEGPQLGILASLVGLTSKLAPSCACGDMYEGNRSGCQVWGWLSLPCHPTWYASKSLSISGSSSSRSSKSYTLASQVTVPLQQLHCQTQTGTAHGSTLAVPDALAMSGIQALRGFAGGQQPGRRRQRGRSETLHIQA